MLGKVVKESIKNNLTGLEGLVGVPGTLGGALMMNAGAWGAEISNYLLSVDVISNNGEIKLYIQMILNSIIDILHLDQMNLYYLQNSN